MPLAAPKLRFQKREITTSDNGATFNVLTQWYYWDGHAKNYHVTTIANVEPANLITETGEADDAADEWLVAQVAP